MAKKLGNFSFQKASVPGASSHSYYENAQSLFEAEKNRAKRKTLQELGRLPNDDLAVSNQQSSKEKAFDLLVKSLNLSQNQITDLLVAMNSNSASGVVDNIIPTEEESEEIVPEEVIDKHLEIVKPKIKKSNQLEAFYEMAHEAERLYAERNKTAPNEPPIENSEEFKLSK